jgi:hypothetical protein
MILPGIHRYGKRITIQHRVSFGAASQPSTNVGKDKMLNPKTKKKGLFTSGNNHKKRERRPVLIIISTLMFKNIYIKFFLLLLLLS